MLLRLADLIASTITLPQESRQAILDTVDPVERLQNLSLMLAKELDAILPNQRTMKPWPSAFRPGSN